MSEDGGGRPLLRDRELARVLRNSRSSAPVAFVDESYRLSTTYGPPFYTMTGVQVARASLDDVRRAVLRVGRSSGGRPWHTTEAYEEGRLNQIRSMVQLAGEISEWSIVTVDVPLPDTSRPEADARAACLTTLAVELTRGDRREERIIVLDRRDQVGDRADMKLSGLLRGNGTIPRGTLIRHSSDDLEPLLCLPDVVGWASRRLLAEGEQWIAPAAAVVTVVDATTGHRYSAEDLAQKYNNAGRAAALPASPDLAAGVPGGAKPELLSDSVSHDVPTASTPLTDMAAARAASLAAQLRADPNSRIPGPKPGRGGSPERGRDNGRDR